MDNEMTSVGAREHHTRPPVNIHPLLSPDKVITGWAMGLNYLKKKKEKMTTSSVP